MMFADYVKRNRTLGKLRAFSKLPHGWHYGVGGPVRAEVIGHAETLYQALILNGLTHTDAFPGSAGEILLTAYKDQFYIALMIGDDGSIDASLEEDNDELASAEGLDCDSARDWLRGEVSKVIWNTSGLYTRAILTTFEADSMTWPSRSLQATGVCRYSTGYAPKQLVA